MRLVLVCDNRSYRKGLVPSWGLSIGIEDGTGWTLFDLGNDPEIFLNNFTALGGELARVNRVILSHLHHDHAGGLGAFQGVGKAIPLYLPEKLPGSDENTLSAWGFEIGYVPPGGIKVGNLWILPMKQGEPPEQLLVIELTEKIVLLTGCAHFGIENGLVEMWHRFGKPFSLICGGFHFAFRSPVALKETLMLMDSLPIDVIVPCHCTGDEAIEVFARNFPGKFKRAGVGWEFLIGNPPQP